jgi:hypothetical protein
MLSSEWKERLLKTPGALWVVRHLNDQGHTPGEAEAGGLLMAGLVLFIFVMMLNSFILAMIRGFFSEVWESIGQNPMDAVGLGFFVTVLFLGVLFKMAGQREEKVAADKITVRQQQALLISRKESLARGAMGHFDDLLRMALKEKYPEVTVNSIHVVDTVPRIKFAARMFRAEMGGDVSGNYKLFRDSLLRDTAHILEIGFSISENVPAIIVDGMMSFITGKAKFYDGAVLSVKATREIYRQVHLTDSNLLKGLSVFDLRYNDGMEVEAFPEEESKNARILERIKAQAPRLEVRYESKREKIDDGWENALPNAAPPQSQDPQREKALSGIALAEFQVLAQGLLTQLGFEVGKVKKIPGGTLQMLADFQHPVLGGQFMILARQYPENAQVHADLVRELDELAREENCKRGIYLVTGQFTEEAKNGSRKMAVDLIDGRRLQELLKEPPYDQRWVFNQGDEKGLLLDLSQMSLLDFEHETDRFLKTLGFRISKIRRADGGAVIAVVEHSHPVIGGKFAVLAKQFPETTQIPGEIVSEFSHVMASEFCYRGLLMAPAYFSLEARALARFSGVELVDRSIWENLRRRYLAPS